MPNPAAANVHFDPITIQHLRDYASSAPDSLPVPEKYEIADLLDAYDNLHALLTEMRGAYRTTPDSDSDPKED